jgi:uncharacterized Zn finger protein (UPF0148 family)
LTWATRSPEDARRFPASRSTVLNCPGCGKKVADGTTICPSCDYIIDASFISTDAPQDDDEQAPPSRPARAPGARSSTGRPSTNARARPVAPPVANEDATNIKSMEEIVRNAPPRAAAGKSNPNARPVAPRASGSAPRPAAPPPRRARETEVDPADVGYQPSRGTSSGNESGLIAAPEDVFEEFRQFVSLMGFSDKVALGGVGLIVLSGFFPWKETAAEGDILGLMSLGLVCIVAALAILGTITLRVRRMLPNVNVLLPWLGQLALSIFCVVWCIVFMKISTDASAVPSLMGNAKVMNSSPSMGAYMGIVGSLACLAGTLLGLKEKPAS